MRPVAGFIKPRVAVALLSLSVAGSAAWMSSEGFSAEPYIPTTGDVPTIGNGSTHYEDGTPVRLTDPPITRERAAKLANNLAQRDQDALKRSIPDAALSQQEYDSYVDFIGQYGIGTWAKSSMRANVRAEQYRAACDALLKYKFQAGRDCSRPENWGPHGCKGVWVRQQERHARCLGGLQ